jgi:hypothetical protein
MADFKVKNLMIDVVAGDAQLQLKTVCKVPSKLCNYLISKCLKYISNVDCPVNLYSHGCPHCSVLSPTPHTTYCAANCEVPSKPVWCLGSDTPIVVDTNILVSNPELINEVENELKQVIQAARERSVEIDKALGPQTKKEAQILEAELKAALKEVQTMMTKLG